MTGHPYREMTPLPEPKALRKVSWWQYAKCWMRGHVHFDVGFCWNVTLMVCTACGTVRERKTVPDGDYKARKHRHVVMGEVVSCQEYETYVVGLADWLTNINKNMGLKP